MSYILEALKKAQAERQLGSAPTLDALPVHPAPSAPARRTMPALALTLGVAAVAAIALAAWWRPAPVLVASTPARVVVTPAPAPAPAAPAPASPPMAVAPASTPAPARKAPPPAEKVAAAAVAAPVTAPAAVAGAPAEPRLPTLRELPDNVRAAIPQVSFGGYMYSNNPGDRLLLVDKVLRHEGEEVAPGLVLEKLLPKAAQMNYRGTRYQVPY